MSYERMVKKESELEAEIVQLRENVHALLSEAERVDAEEDERFGADPRGDELPEELQRRETRLQKIREAKEALEQEAREAETERRPPNVHSRPFSLRHTRPCPAITSSPPISDAP